MLSADAILAATRPEAIFGSEDPIVAFRRLALVWHPDHSTDPRAGSVVSKLVQLRDQALGKAELVFTIAGGKVAWAGQAIRFSCDENDAKRALQVSKHLASADPELAKRIIAPIGYATGALCFAAPPGFVPLPALQARYLSVPQGHVAWIASRLFEFVMLAHKKARVGCFAFSPESCALHPENHAIIPLDFRFVVDSGSQLSRVPGFLADLVPPDKGLHTSLDLAAIHRLALILLGDPSGIGNLLRLKPDIHPTFLDWFRAAPVLDPIEHYSAYRRLLQDCFGKPKYLKLEL